MGLDTAAEAKWRQVFAARIIERTGMGQCDADQHAAAATIDLTEDAAEMADSEMSYWDADE